MSERVRSWNTDEKRLSVQDIRLRATLTWDLNEYLELALNGPRATDVKHMLEIIWPWK